MKKILSFVLVFMMLCTMMPVTSYAAASNDYTQWKQYDAEWNQAQAWTKADYPYATMFYMADCGCLVTSIAMLLRHYNVVVSSDVNKFNPWICNEELKAADAFDCAADLYFGRVENAYPGMKYVGVVGYSLTELKALYNAGYACVVKVNGSGGYYHFVAVKSIDGDIVSIMDPGSNSTNLSAYGTKYEIYYYAMTPGCTHNYNNLGVCTSTCKQAYDWQATFNDDCAGIYKVSLSGGIYLRTDKPYSASTAKSELIKAGTEVKVLGSVLNAVGTEHHRWYKVSYNGIEGYTSEDNLTLVPHTCDKGTYMYYEEAHPHRSCYKCSICGKIWAEAGSTNKMPSCQQCAASSEHTCNKGTYMYYEEVHPHRSCYKCSICGKIWAADDTTNYMSSCLECQKPGKPVLTNLSGKTFQDNESVTFTWAATSNTTHYNLYMQHKNSSGQWEKYDQIFYVSSGMKLTLPANEYRCYIQSYNSNYWAADGSDWLYTEGDFTYFTVTPADHLPTAVCDEVTGKENSIYVRGWAFDVDTPNKSLDIHVYVDGAFAGAGTANGSRPDVNNVYGCGNNHGFAFSVPYKVSVTGKHTVKVFALNTAAGKNHRLIGSFDVTVTAHVHAYTSKVTTAATCVKNGTRTYTCSGCSSSYTETIPATGEHSWDAGKITTHADCVTEGVRTYYCYYCDATRQETIDKTTGHLYNIKEVAPTCVEDGYDGYICVRCGYIEIVFVRPATGEHTWATSIVTKKPTCGENGVRTYDCCYCDATKTEAITATGDHNWGAWTTIVEATCKQEGTQRRACGTCGKTQEQTVDVTEHNYGKWQTVIASTCTTPGQRKHICNICGNEESEAVAANGHSYVSLTVEPQCETQGYTQHGCWDCYDYYEDAFVPALGHQYENGYCTRCDAEDPENPAHRDVLGDFTDDNSVTNEDVIYLLWHSLFPDTYPVDSQADFTRDGQVTNEDVIYLLWHTLFPENYPLQAE